MYYITYNGGVGLSRSRLVNNLYGGGKSAKKRKKIVKSVRFREEWLKDTKRESWRNKRKGKEYMRWRRKQSLYLAPQVIGNAVWPWHLGEGRDEERCF